MSNKYISEITIIYNIYENPFNFKEKQEIINIFGEKFVKNNRNNCKMIIDNKEYNIKEKFKITNNNNDILNIKLKGIENIIDMSNMFKDCTSLLTLSDISKLNINNIIDMSYMFNNCLLLSSLPDISKWNTNNVTNMSYMFNNCKSLLSLPDISKWNTNNVTNMSYMFNNCESLSSLPDISRWNINNVISIHYIFGNCISLLNLSDVLDFYTCGIDIEAIELVMDEVKVSRKEAIKALLKTNGDPLEALLEL